MTAASTSARSESTTCNLLDSYRSAQQQDERLVEGVLGRTLPRRGGAVPK
jgi:hypothetical protein